jgi:hypothetical protein
MVTSIGRRYQAWRRYVTVRRELSHLTDRELADIVSPARTLSGSPPAKRVAN